MHYYASKAIQLTSFGVAKACSNNSLDYYKTVLCEYIYTQYTNTHTHAYTHAGAIAVTSGRFSDPSLFPTVSGVQCTGSETDLLSCSHSNIIDRSSCGNHDDAGVVCQGG